jgi:hypothetical protein
MVALADDLRDKGKYSCLFFKHTLVCSLPFLGFSCREGDLGVDKYGGQKEMIVLQIYVWRGKEG